MKTDRSDRWLTRGDEGHDMRLRIGDLARAAATPGWSRLVARHAQVGAYAVTTLTCDGREIVAEGLREPFQRLRELSYQTDAGTWFTCELTFPPGSRRYTGRVDCTTPPFEDVPAAAALAELSTLPRRNPPGWLLNALPTAPPLPLPFSYGERYEGWRHDFDDRRPRHPLPISGDVAYLPAAGMTARELFHGQGHGRQSLYLARRADDLEHDVLTVSCHKDGYWVARHGMRGTGEGLRSITLLDGPTLRLELTPEAADLLETETVFDVRLALPPETAAEVRAVLSRMLRPVSGAPELIGF